MSSSSAHDASSGSWLALCLLALGACGDEPRSGAIDSVDAADGGDGAVSAEDAATPARDAGGPSMRDATVPSDGATPPPRDASGPPPACDPVAQTGCAAGQRCNQTLAGLACVPAGTLAPFARCALAADACVAGTSCADTNFDDARCTPFCDPETLSGCPGAGQTCRLRRAQDAFALCSFAHECSPVKQDCASPAQRCAWTLLGAFCITQTARIPDGAECTSAVGCSAGSTCADDGAGRTRCSKQCDPDAQPDSCGAGAACAPYAEVWPQALGLCRPTP